MEEEARIDNTPIPVWFVERGDGMIFACQEAEAWNLIANPSTWARRDFKFIGHSDGRTFAKIKSTGTSECARLQAEKKALEDQLERLVKTEDRLLFDELLDDEHEKVKHVRKLKENLHAKLDPIEDELKNFVKNLNQRAFDAELAVARKNAEENGGVKKPRNMNIIPATKGREDEIYDLLKHRK